MKDKMVGGDYFLRVGRDQNVIDRLLTPDLLQINPIPIDGVVLDAPYLKGFERFRENLGTATRVIVDPQSYRFQADTCFEVAALKSLSYCPPNRAFVPSDFTGEFTKRFVRSTLDTQKAILPTSFIAPSFYLEGRASDWRDVNRRLLREAISQAGQKVLASLCASSAVLRDVGLVGQISTSGATGVYLQISPLTAMTDGVSKITDYLRFVGQFWNAGLEVIATRQPAFGPGLVSLGIASFDSGIAQAEDFSFKDLVRKRLERKDGKSGGGSRRRVYFRDLMTTLSHEKATALLGVPSLRSLLSCDEFCCKFASNRALVRPDEHFLWSRAKEVQELRALPPEWRSRSFIDRTERARKIGEKVEQTLPNTRFNFQHLSHWQRAIEAFAGTLHPVGG